MMPWRPTGVVGEGAVDAKRKNDTQEDDQDDPQHAVAMVLKARYNKMMYSALLGATKNSLNDAQRGPRRSPVPTRLYPGTHT